MDTPGTPNKPQPPRSVIDALSPVWTVAIIVVTGWFLFPVLNGTYTEGFQSTISAIARAMINGHPMDADLVYPFTARFYLVTRLGSELILSAFMRFDHLSGLINFRVVMALSLMILVGSIVHILWCHYRIRPLYALLPCLLFPVVFESSYFFNDNLTSAAFSALAIAVFWGPINLLRTACAAVLLGLAVTIRLDAAFLAPIFLIILWFEFPNWRLRLQHGLVAAAIVTAAPITIYASMGISFFDSFAVAKDAIALWNRHPSPSAQTGMSFAILLQDMTKEIVRLAGHLLNGFAMPGILAMGLGIASFLVDRRWREILLCVGTPALYVLAYNRSLYDVRYLLQLAPLIAIAMAEGGRVILRQHGRLRLISLFTCGLTVAVCFLPPAVLALDSDGPRPFLGRAWSPALWSRWTASLNGGIAALDKLLEQEAKHETMIVVVSGDWTSDRLVNLTAVEHGFIADQQGADPACQSVAEFFRRGEVSLLHVRTNLPFLIAAREGVTWEEAGLPCLEAMNLAQAKVLFVNWTKPNTRVTDASSLAITRLYQPAVVSVRTLGHSSMKYLEAYYIDRVPVSAIARLLRQPDSDAERRAAREDVAERTKILR